MFDTGVCQNYGPLWGTIHEKNLHTASCVVETVEGKPRDRTSAFQHIHNETSRPVGCSQVAESTKYG